MPAMTEMRRPDLTASNLFTVSEAAWVSETRRSFVDKEIHNKVVEVASQHERRLAEYDLLYFLAVRGIRSAVNRTLRKAIYRRLRTALVSGECERVAMGPFELRLEDLMRTLHERLARMRAAHDAVDSREGVRGGETVVRGTRVPVRLLAEMADQDADEEELAREYELTPDQVSHALLYARLHPKRGRPARTPREKDLADLGTVARADIEELGDLSAP